MSYATVEQFKTPAYGLPASYLAKVGDADIEAALAQASGTADTYLRQRYRLPLTAWSDDLSGAVAHIAAYRLVTGRGFTGQGSDEHLYLRYKDAMSWLKDVAGGKATPEVTETPADPTQPDAPSPGEATAIVTNPRRGWS